MKPLQERVMTLDATRLEVVGHSAPRVPIIQAYAGEDFLGTFDLAGVKGGAVTGADGVRIRVGHLLPVGREA